MKRIKKNDCIDKGKVLEFKRVAENSIDQDLALKLKLEFVYGDYIYNQEFVKYYLDTIPDLFRLYEFEQVNHVYFGMFLSGLPKLISILGEDID